MQLEAPLQPGGQTLSGLKFCGKLYLFIFILCTVKSSSKRSHCLPVDKSDIQRVQASPLSVALFILTPSASK